MCRGCSCETPIARALAFPFTFLLSPVLILLFLYVWIIKRKDGGE